VHKVENLLIQLNASTKREYVRGKTAILKSKINTITNRPFVETCTLQCIKAIRGVTYAKEYCCMGLKEAKVLIDSLRYGNVDNANKISITVGDPEA